MAGGWCWLSSGSLPEAVDYNTSVLLTLVTLCGWDSSKNTSWVWEGLFQLVKKEAADPYGPTSEAPRGHPPDSTNQSKSQAKLKAREVKWSESCSVVSDSLWAHGLYSPWSSPGQNTGAGSLFLLQGIFPTQGLNPGLPHCRQILYQLNHKGSPRIPGWVAFPFSRGSSQPRDWTQVSCIAGRFFTSWAMMEAQKLEKGEAICGLL